MQKPLKILVVRFSSIGDIVLTTPIVRCLNIQKNAEIHFLTKYKYKEILENNPHIKRIHTLDNSIADILNKLKQENYDYIIDLHNNLRSNLLYKLRVPSYKVCKSNFKKFLLIRLGINLLSEEHTVDRYMKTVKSLSVKNDGKGLDYYIDPDIKINFNINQKFIAWSLASTHNLKKLPVDKIINVCNHIKMPIVLLGSNKEIEDSEIIIKSCSNTSIHNFCGKLSLDQSSYLIQNSELLLTNDTGLMHIASAFRKKIISFWGCTKPILGFSPYFSDSKSFEILADDSYRPCSKHGKSCRYGSNICINRIKSESIITCLRSLGFIE